MDPDKYSKNRHLSPDNLYKTIIDMIKFCLMILGLVGVGFEFFKEKGWLKTALAKIFESTTTMMIAIPAIIIVLWVLNNMMSSKSQDQKNTSGDLPMYLMMILGAYYLFTFISTGSM